jgi:DHA2 family multidrug resistance protein
MRGVGNFISFFVVAQLTRINAKATLAAGLLIQAAAGAWMGQLDMNMTENEVMWTNLLHGFGFGLAYTPMAALAFSTLETRLLTQGNAIFSLLRMMGSSLFIAITFVVFLNSAAEAYSNLIGYVSVFNAELLEPWVQRFGDVSSRSFAVVAQEEVRRQAVMAGYINAFHLMTIAPAIAAPIVLFFKSNKR